MLKKFLMKKMLQSQLKGVPEAEQEKILNVIEKNPDLFTKIAKDVQERMKQGKDQMTATMEVMKENEAELRKIM